jgi:hypothetical protein
MFTAEANISINPTLCIAGAFLAYRVAGAGYFRVGLK